MVMASGSIGFYLVALKEVKCFLGSWNSVAEDGFIIFSILLRPEKRNVLKTVLKMFYNRFFILFDKD